MHKVTNRGRALVEGRISETAVVVQDGTITAISTNSGGAGGDSIDLQPNQILVPAGVDLAAHYRDWGQAFKETVETGSRGALAGGITTICDMPNTVPNVNTVETIERRVALFRDRSYCDFALSAMQPVNPAEVEGFKDAGAFAIHLFAWDVTGWNFPDEFDPLPARIKHWTQLGLQGSVHVEDQSLRQTPLETESERYALPPMLDRLDPEFKVRLRVSLADSVEKINQAKERLPNIQVQGSPHYFFVSQREATRKIGVAGLGAPLLGDEANLAKVQQQLRQGAFDICVSDHFPHRLQDKYHEHAVRVSLWPKRGFSSIDFAYPLMLERAGLAEGARLFAENPARVLGIKKGKIAKGYEADLAVLEEGTWLVCPDEFESKGKVTPLAGERMAYRVARTFMRGVEVYNAGKGAGLSSGGGPRTFNKIPIRKVA
jgi:dihydroorotase